VWLLTSEHNEDLHTFYSLPGVISMIR